jgi:hypothetical protein
MLAFDQFSPNLFGHGKKLAAREVGADELNSHSNLSAVIIDGFIPGAEARV